MAWFVSIIRDWFAGVICAGAAVLSGYTIFVQGPAGSDMWLHVVFLLAILLGTVTFVRLLAKAAIASMDRGIGQSQD